MRESEKYIGNELELFSNAIHWKSYFSKQFHPYIKGRVLEAGAGIGETTPYLMKGKEHLASWTCMEPDKNLAGEIELKISRQLLPELCRVVISTSDNLDPAPTFDSILYIDVIEHIENDGAELERAATLLNSKGFLNILVPAHQYLYSPFDRSIGHYRRYNKQRLLDVIPPSLKPVQLRYLDTVGVFSSLANKLLLKKSHPTLGQVKFWDNFIVPVSRITDPLLGFRVGKTLIGTWQKP